MAKIHDLFIIELAEVIKGYGNDPDVEDPFRLSEFYRFYELPNIAVSRENFEKMRPVEPELKRGKWNFIGDQMFECTECGVCYTQNQFHQMRVRITDPEFPNFCPNCGADMRDEQDG